MISLYSKFNSNLYELHMLALDRVAAGSIVLDVGCATGAFAEKLTEKGCEVYGLELNAKAAQVARKVCKEVKVVDLETMKSIPYDKKFDCIIILEVIEHLRNPEHLLELCKKRLKKGGKILISTPNIAYINQRINHLLGKFDYTDTGTLDKTHVHLYTKSSLINFVESAGLKIQSITPTTALRNVIGIGEYLRLLPHSTQYSLSAKFDTLLGYQFLIESRSK